MVERRIIAIAADPDNDDDGDESTGKMIPHLRAAERNVAQQLMAILNYDFQVPFPTKPPPPKKKLRSLCSIASYLVGVRFPHS